MAIRTRSRRPSGAHATSLLAAAALLAESAQGADNVSAWANALLRDSETTLHLRSHYLARDKSSATDSLAWAAGGWLGYRTGWIGDTLRLGLTAYTSRKLHGPANQDGTALLLAGQKSYSVLGEAYAAFKLDGHVLTAGKFLVNQFEVNPQDTRMTPRTFEGLALAGRIGGMDYFAGRLDRMKHRHWDVFEKVATVAGTAPDATEPLWLVSARGMAGDDLSLGFASYRLDNLLASTYAEAAWVAPLGAATRFRLGGQYMRQGSIGDNRLTGTAFDTWSAGLKADIIQGPLTLSGIVMKTDRGAAYRMPFGSWAGYTSRIITNFNRAGEAVRAIDAIVDFSRLGAPGLMLTASATVGAKSIDAASGAGLPKNTEYNLTADYRFTAADWPGWARPLALRARWGRLEQRLGGTVDLTTEYHLILNYALSFK